ncbi:ligand-gated channel [Hyphomonas sp. CACIAM 19H1]|uniref:TonB-dependent siderophore receptor n=1 Tax=Hyphomonas sp. CACIAM 19H1 TaxID=1873716 RepID=UPI000DEDC074|nr:TonB-dependent receptor [Hyphomonas sp. CACIAM 19H1]AXE63968.1 ligand-gated channel [Hyphomonas sp. CACIAM 19H1]
MQSKFSRRLLSGAALLALCAPAFAQAADEDASWRQDTVVVTGQRADYSVSGTASATRTDAPLIEVPQSVQVLTGALLREQDRRQLNEALINVSGVTPTRSDENLFIPPIMRGFPAEVYLDGLPIFAGNQQAYDPSSLTGVERIEVLKGPTATLYGGGLGTPLGGLINVASARPDAKRGGYVALRGGSFSTINPYGEFNAPLTDAISARIAAEYQSADSWIDLVEGERWSVQPSFLFELSPQTELLVQGQFNHRSSLEYSGIPAEQALAGTIERDVFPGSPIGQPRTENDNRIGTVSLRHIFSDQLELNVTGRYYRGTIDEYGSFVFPDLFPADPATPTVYPVAPVTMDTRTKEATFDANLTKRAEVLGGDHTLLLGVNYDRTDFYSGMGLFVSDTPSGTIDLADPDYNLSYTPQLPVNSYTDDRFETYAAYVQDQASYGRLHLTGGLRVTSLKFVENSNIGVANDSTYTHVSPRIGATFDLVPGVAAYAGYATAFRAPFGFIGLASPRPETSDNLEGGLKLDLPATGLSGTVAAFRQVRDDVTVSDPDNLGFYIQSGRQRASGLELDLVWEPVPAFSLLANYAYTDTRDEGVAPGDELTRVPNNSGRIAARYRVLDGSLKGLSFGAGVTAFSSRELTLPNTVAVPGYAAIDAQASYEFDHFTVGVSAINLGGREAFDPFSYFGNAIVAPNQPRSVFLTLKAGI